MTYEDTCSPEKHWSDGGRTNPETLALLKHLRETKVPGFCPLCKQHTLIIGTQGDDPPHSVNHPTPSYPLFCGNCGNYQLLHKSWITGLKDKYLYGLKDKESSDES